MGGLPNIEHRRLHAFRGGCRARPVEKTIARAQPRPAPARVSICRCLCWAVRFRRFATHLHHSLATLRNLSLAAAGLACLRPRTRIIMLSLIVLAWIPNLVVLNQDPSHWNSIREISRMVSANSHPSDLILVHSIPSGVLGVARYASGPAGMASWFGQLGNRRVPGSIQQLAAGRKRILFVKLHEVGEPAPEEDWLRANATSFGEPRFESAEAVDFRPRGSEAF